jgi:hypothetical protein
VEERENHRNHNNRLYRARRGFPAAGEDCSGIEPPTMFAALMLAATLVTPTPTPVATAFPLQTPPPEPNHVTVTGSESYVQAYQEYWPQWTGVTTQLSGMYEFQANSHLRLANTLHWERLSSTYITNFNNVVIPWRFNFTEYHDELDVELGRPWYPTGVGVGYYDYNPVYDAGRVYNLAGFGVGVDRWANWNVPRSLYYSVWYYPNVRGSQANAGAYGITRLDVGMNIRQSLVSPWGIRIGLQNETWFANNANAEYKNFAEPYVSLSWWQ